MFAPDRCEGRCGDTRDEIRSVDEATDDVGALAVEGAAGDVFSKVVDAGGTCSEAGLGVVHWIEASTKTKHFVVFGGRFVVCFRFHLECGLVSSHFYDMMNTSCFLLLL